MTYFRKFLAVLCILAVGRSSEVDLSKENYNKTWMWMSNGNNEPEIAYLVEPPPKARENSIASGIDFEFWGNESSPLTWSYWFPKNKAMRQKRETWSQITERFDPSIETKILVHGWKSSSMSNTIQSIKNEYLKKGKHNIIAVNWRNQADNIYYLEPARYTVQVGKAVANLIDMLVEQKSADPKKIHLIGHSLGAHIMGYAGSYSRHRISRITGLDPARPAFEVGITGPEVHLDPTDADFVDVIHSCAGVLGFEKPIGFVDFYPNGGGYPQPGCGEKLVDILRNGNYKISVKFSYFKYTNLIFSWMQPRKIL